MTSPTASALLSATLGLAKELSLDLSEETLGERFLATLTELLPGRALVLRFVDGSRHELSSLFFNLPRTGTAEGAVVLDEDAARGPLLLKRAALRHTGLPEDVATSARVRLTDRYVPLLSGTLGGFSVPLVASGELLGLVNCEYVATGKPASELLRKRDEAAMIPLCNQLSVALCNLRLLHRARSYEGYFQRMIDAVRALVVVVDREGRVTIVNQPMVEVSGFAVGDALEALRARSGRGEGPYLCDLLADALRGVEVSGVEVVLARPSGPAQRAIFNVTALRNASGQIEGAAAMGQDLERVRGLERQVLQAERLATLGQLAAGVVHELNNPLSSIEAYGEHLTRRLKEAGPEFRDDADRARRICEGAQRIKRLTADLTSYGRPGGGKERLGLRDVVAQALSFCEHVIAQSGARVAADHAEDLPQVIGVRTQLQQVVVNLITNACHAITEKHREGTARRRGRESARLIRIRTTPASLDGVAAVELSVEDNGSGIPEMHRLRVFEPFFSTKPEGQGTGLGLSIVKNIVDAHGGRIGFETSYGRGTRFSVLLPAAPDPGMKSGREGR